jgi:PKD repeat protein
MVSANPTVGFTKLVVSFDGTKSYDIAGQPLLQYQWDFGDGSIDKGAQVAHTYDQTGSFTATLTVMNHQGLKSTASVSVSVLDPASSTLLPPDDLGNPDDSSMTTEKKLDFRSLHTIYFQDYSEPSDMALGDLNKDGFVDIVLTHPHQLSVADHILVLFGDGKGNFGEELVRPEPNLVEVRENAMAESGDTPVSVTLADFNNDEFLDIATVNAISKDISILFGDGTGKLLDYKIISLDHRFPTSLRSADFNGDGFVDLLIANSFPAKLTAVFNKGNREFATPRDIEIGRWPILAFALGSINDDNLPDFSVLDKSGYLKLICSDRDGEFYLLGSHRVRGVETASSVGLGDFNGDHHTDIALSVENANASALRLYLLGNEGTGLNKPADRALDRDIRDLQLGDLNLDQKLDTVTVLSPTGNSDSARLGIFVGDGAGEFKDPLFFSLDEARVLPKKLLLADFDNDGDLDAITLNASAKLPLRASGSLTILMNTLK